MAIIFFYILITGITISSFIVIDQTTIMWIILKQEKNAVGAEIVMFVSTIVEVEVWVGVEIVVQVAAAAAL